MKARSLQGAIAFYLASRRRLGFALKSEGALLENLVKYARRLRCRGPLTTELALNWAQVPPPPHADETKRLLSARAVNSLEPMGTAIFFSSLIRISTFPVATSFDFAPRITNTKAITITVKNVTPRIISNIVFYP